MCEKQQQQKYVKICVAHLKFKQEFLHTHAPHHPSHPSLETQTMASIWKPVISFSYLFFMLKFYLALWNRQQRTHESDGESLEEKLKREEKKIKEKNSWQKKWTTKATIVTKIIRHDDDNDDGAHRICARGVAMFKCNQLTAMAKHKSKRNERSSA